MEKYLFYIGVGLTLVLIYNKFIKGSSYDFGKKIKDFKLVLRGKIGEFKVKCALKSKGVYLKNQYYYDKYNTLREIDGILVNDKGLFVIEVKNWKKNVAGKISADQWFDVKNNKDVYNPLKQNEKHIYNTNYVLYNRFKNVIFNRVIMVGKGEFELYDDNYKVVKDSNVKRIRSFTKELETLPKVLEKKDIKYVVNILKANNVTSKRERKNHLKNAKRMALKRNI